MSPQLTCALSLILQTLACAAFHWAGWLGCIDKETPVLRAPSGRFVSKKYRGFVWREIP